MPSGYRVAVIPSSCRMHYRLPCLPTESVLEIPPVMNSEVISDDGLTSVLVYSLENL